MNLARLSEEDPSFFNLPQLHSCPPSCFSPFPFTLPLSACALISVDQIDGRLLEDILLDANHFSM